MRSLAPLRVHALPGGPPFAFVAPSHPLRPDVERFWAAAEEVPALARLLEGGTRTSVRSVLRLYPGERRLKWLNVSVQRQADTGFAAVTLHFRARKRRLDVFELPADPLLPALRAVDGEVSRVLQYVPRHRFTYRARWDGVIGKIPRAADLQAGWERLEAVWRAVERAGASFAVAQPLVLDRARGVFYQSPLGGRAISDLVDAGTVDALLRRAGAVQAELQTLDVAGLPTWTPAEIVPQLREHARLVALFRPSAAGLVSATEALLLATLPEPGRPAFCHGDLRCGHLLDDGGRSSVIDFDGCRNGDPAQDVARLLAFLKRDVPYLRDRFAAPDGGHEELDAATSAFLEGHAEAAGRPLEPARLAWFLLAHELHFLARMFKRDLHDPVAFTRSADRLAELGDRLRDELRGRRRP